MLGVTPASLVTGDVSCGTVFERHRPCRVELRLPPFGPPRIDGVNAVVPLQSKLGRSLACLNEADGVKRCQLTPSPPLPRKRGREQTEFAAHTDWILSKPTLPPVGDAHAAPGVAHLLVVNDGIVDLDPEAEDLRR